MLLKGVYIYHLPLLKPLHMKNRVLSTRTGFLFNYEKDNISVWGDAAPFPGLHIETIDDILDWLKSKPYLINNLSDIEDVKTPFPSLDFALSACIFKWQSKKNGYNLRHYLSSKSKDRIPVNALITGTGEEALRSLQKAQNNGYKSFKIKVGKQSLENDIKLIQRIAEKLSGVSLLRLDANQAWTLKDALNFCRRCKDLPIEYLEEPLKNSKDIPKLHAESAIPVALDESLNDQIPEFLDYFDEFDIIVLKPSRIGSIKKLLYWFEKADQKNKKAIISSSFDSGIGLHICAEIAAAKTSTSAGLDTFSWFKNDVIDPPFRTENGYFNFKDFRINKGLLNEIDL